MSTTNTPVTSFTKEVNPRLAKRPLITNACLANLELTSLVKEATGVGGGGVTNGIFSVRLFSKMFTIFKALVTYWIPRSYLTGVKYDSDANYITDIFTK